MTLDDKRQRLEEVLRSCGRVLVAFSGGVDSTLLAVVARRALGKAKAPAVTADSPSMAREDLAEATRLARALDLEHVVVATDEVARPDYQANGASRCFICKQTLFESLSRLAAQRHIRAVVYGVLADDVIGERPGHQAALQAGVRAPLQEAGLTKEEVRALARALGLPNWDKPQNACLSSRIPHGAPVTVEKLSQVERAEAWLRAQGFRQVRVRHVGDHARIEVGPEEVARFRDASLRLAAAQAFERIGFVSVGVSRHGYRRGGADLAAADDVQLEEIAAC